MSINLLKVVSTLNEHADPFIDSQEYNDIIHGRKTREVQDSYRDIEFDQMPIVPETSNWLIIEKGQGDALYRSYVFSKFKTLFYFISEALKKQEKMNHHALMCIEENTVEIILQTRSVNTVTERDKELSEDLDDIYKDTKFFTSNEAGSK
jgi:4a-hydroxytetrahydrobiopterin dehydratase